MVWQHLQNSPHSSGSSKKPFLTYWLPEVQERPFVCGPSLWDGVLETLWFCLLLTLQGQQQGHSLGFAFCETKMVMPGAWFFFFLCNSESSPSLQTLTPMLKTSRRYIFSVSYRIIKVYSTGRYRHGLLRIYNEESKYLLIHRLHSHFLFSPPLKGLANPSSFIHACPSTIIKLAQLWFLKQIILILRSNAKRLGTLPGSIIL